MAVAIAEDLSDSELRNPDSGRSRCSRKCGYFWVAANGPDEGCKAIRLFGWSVGAGICPRGLLL